MKILFATGHLPSMKGRQAGAKTSYGMCRFFAQSHEIHLAAFANADELSIFDQDEMSIFTSWKIFPVSASTRIAGILLAPHLPLLIGAKRSNAFKRHLRRLQAQHDFDVVILDHTNLFQYSDLFPVSTLTVGSAHDIFTQAWERRESSTLNVFKRICATWERRRIQDWEHKAFHALGVLVVQSKKDELYVEKNFSPQRRPSVISPWIHRSPPVEDALDERKHPNSLLFWGAMDRQENIDAATWVAKEIHPLIRRSIPDATFYIAGNRSKDLEPQLGQCEGVVLLGFIEDIAAMMKSMEIALLPLRLGAGIKVKTLECMDAGMPVVTTEVGAEGIDGTNDIELVIRATEEQLAQAAIELLINKERACAIGNAGQRMINRNYDFDGKLRELEARLSKISECEVVGK